MNQRLFFRLLKNESLKLYKQKMPWIMISILVIIILLTLTMSINAEEVNDENWKNKLIQELNELNMQLTDETIPLSYKKGYIENEIKLNEYRITNNIPPLFNRTAWGFVKATSGFTNIITFFIIILASSSVSQEYVWGTIKLLFMKPVRKWKYLFAKFFSITIICVILYLSLFIVSLIVGAIFFGFNNTSLRYIYLFKGEVFDTSIYLHFLKYYGSKFIGTIMIAGFAFMLSTILKNNALAISVSIILQFSGSIISDILMNLDKGFSKYLFFSNTNLYQYVEGTPKDGMTLSFSSTILIMHFILFFVISIFVFEKREARG